MGEKIKLDISIGSIVKVIVALALIYLLFLLRDVILILFITVILIAAFYPIVNKWSKKIGKTWAVLALILFFVAITVGFFYIVVPPMIEQLSQLINALPDYLKHFSLFKNYLPNFDSALSSVVSNLSGLTGGFISATTSFVGGVATFLTIIVLTAYFLIDEKVYSSFIETILPAKKNREVRGLFSKISKKVGDWLRGQIILGLVIGIITYIGLSIIGVKYALVLAVITGFLEIVPIIGPIISGTLATLIALTVSPVIALITALFYILIQQLENNIIVPKIMQKAIGLPASIIIIAVLIGGKLLGVVGALMAVPIASVVFVALQEWRTIKSIFTEHE